MCAYASVLTLAFVVPMILSLLLLIFLFVCPETNFYFFTDMRGLYKDLVWLLNNNSLIGADVLKRKVSSEFCAFINIKSHVI
jgi:hypothetical protein